MKIKTSELIGPALDWAVAQCEGEAESAVLRGYVTGAGKPCGRYSPSSDWAQGGPIIEREKLWLTECSGAWCAKPALKFDSAERPETWAPTALIAAMRCYVASKLSDEVDIPEELA